MIRELNIFKHFNYDDELGWLKYLVLKNGEKDFSMKHHVDMFNEYREQLKKLKQQYHTQPSNNMIVERMYHYEQLIKYQKDYILNYIEYHLYDIEYIVNIDFTFRLENGKLHSLDSPAVVKSETCRVAFDDMYYINDKFYEYKQWLIQMRKYKIEKLISNT